MILSAVLFPPTNFILPRSMKSQWKLWNMVESVDIDNQSGFLICVHTWCKTCSFSHNVDNSFGSKECIKMTLCFMCTSSNAWLTEVKQEENYLRPFFLTSLSVEGKKQRCIRTKWNLVSFPVKTCQQNNCCIYQN